ncbi:MAG: Chromosome (plasmid) partitioning protein ParA, partial [uncultured Thermomicrobiales bacterium]
AGCCICQSKGRRREDHERSQHQRDLRQWRAPNLAGRPGSAGELDLLAGSRQGRSGPDRVRRAGRRRGRGGGGRARSASQARSPRQHARSGGRRSRTGRHCPARAPAQGGVRARHGRLRPDDHRLPPVAWTAHRQRVDRRRLRDHPDPVRVPRPRRGKPVDHDDRPGQAAAQPGPRPARRADDDVRRTDTVVVPCRRRGPAPFRRADVREHRAALGAARRSTELRTIDYGIRCRVTWGCRLSCLRLRAWRQGGAYPSSGVVV